MPTQPEKLFIQKLQMESKKLRLVNEIFRQHWALQPNKGESYSKTFANTLRQQKRTVRIDCVLLPHQCVVAF